jgi:hypothetical protein
VNRLTVPAVYIGAFLMLAACSSAPASAEFSGRVAVSADHAGQSFLQVILNDLGEIERLDRVEDSETTYNAMFDAEWDVDLAGPHRLLLENRLRHGTALTRDRFRIGYRYRGDDGERLDLDSETDVEHGKVFDRDETDVRQSVFARWTKPLGGRKDRLEVYGGAEIRRVDADTLFFPQSHNLAKTKVTWTRDFGLLNSFDLGYAVRGVAVVDSTPGSYVEHEVSGNLDMYAGSSIYVNSEAALAVRDYVNADSSSAAGWALLARGTARYSPSIAFDVEAQPAFEAARFDLPDFIYFDYQKIGLDVGLKWRPIDEAGLKVFPGFEVLSAPDVEREDYGQVHVTFGGDVMAPGVWIDLSYRVGSRDYASPAPRDDLESVPRSDYVFGDLLLLADKRIKGPLSLRMTASHNIEWHDLEEDDVSVFLLSTEITYRF